MSCFRCSTLCSTNSKHFVLLKFNLCMFTAEMSFVCYFYHTVWNGLVSLLTKFFWTHKDSFIGIILFRVPQIWGISLNFLQIVKPTQRSFEEDDTPTISPLNNYFIALNHDISTRNFILVPSIRHKNQFQQNWNSSTITNTTRKYYKLVYKLLIWIENIVYRTTISRH